MLRNRGCMRRVLIIAVLCALGGVAGIAQQPATLLRFEVASIKPNTSTDGTINIPPTPPEGVVLHNSSLAGVVHYAYQLPDFRVVGM